MTTNNDAERQNVAVVAGTYEAVGRGDIPALLALLAEDIVWTLQGPPEIPFAGTRRGRAGVAEFFSLVGATLDLQQFEPREFVAQGDMVVVLGYECSAVKATGRTFAHDWAHAYRLKDGLIAEARLFEDTAACAHAFVAS